MNVPTQVIYATVRKHVGLREDSESLPDLVELDEDDYEWAAAAVPPTTSEESTEEGAGYVEDGPTSVIQVGAPPPPPPETPPPTRLGALTPSVSEWWLLLWHVAPFTHTIPLAAL